MAPPLLALAFSMLASGDPVDLVGKFVGFGVASTVLYLVVTGVFRLDREVKAAELRAAAEREHRLREVDAADKRTAVAEARAEREAESRARMQDTVSADLAPALLRVSTSAEALARGHAENAELLEQLIRAVRRVVERP